MLLAGQNFGCGSSREHAVWAIQQMGVGAVIAPSFGDIFRNNSAKMGLLTVTLAPEDVAHLMRLAEGEPSATISVDLESQTVSAPGGWQRSFEVAPFVKHRLLNGLDDISMTLSNEPEIAAFESTRPSELPTTAAERE